MVLDGEIIVVKDGKADFATLIKRIHNTKAREMPKMKDTAKWWAMMSSKIIGPAEGG